MNSIVIGFMDFGEWNWLFTWLCF